MPALSPGETVTLATWYTPKPSRCWDPDRSVPVPDVALYAAAHQPCGTTLEIRGPAGAIVVPVVDHGPNGAAAAAGHGLDLSPAAFRAVAGPLGRGVQLVSYRVVEP